MKVASVSTGLWQEEICFEYALVQGGFRSERYIEVMDSVADKAQKILASTGRITVVVQDNGSLHKSRLTRSKWKQWEEQGLFIFLALVNA